MPVRDQAQSQQERRRQERRQQVARQQRRQSTRRWSIIGSVVLLLVVLGGGGAYFAFAHSNSGSQAGRDIDGISCGGSEMLTYHIHAHLTLYENGQPVPVPALVCIPSIAATYAGRASTLLFLSRTADAQRGVVTLSAGTTPHTP